jgi:hypothetical protein
LFRWFPVILDVRANDARECEVQGFSAAQALMRCIAFSDEVHQCKINGTVVAMWGFRLRGFLTQDIDAWLLTSDEVANHKVQFGRDTKRWVEDTLARGYKSMYVEVHAAYLDAVKWLLWLGFKRVDTKTIGGESFLIMRKDRG